MNVPDMVVQRIVSHFPEVERIILFGSRAHGQMHADSDWDFLIVMPSPLPFAKRGIAIRRVARYEESPWTFLYVPQPR